MPKSSIKIFKNSRTIQQLNRLYLRILQCCPNQKNITILLASSNKREGTTTIAVNLCRLIANNSNENILFIDVNQRNTNIRTIFNRDHNFRSSNRAHLKAESHIAITKDPISSDGNILFLDLDDYNSNIKNVFNIDNNLESTNIPSVNDEAHVFIEKTQIKNIDILTTESGDPQSPAFLHPQGILQYLENLKNRYSLIILDAPPVIPFSDALYLGSATDIFLLIIEAERTRWEVAQEALQRISAAKVKNITTVLNKKRDHIPSIIYRTI